MSTDQDRAIVIDILKSHMRFHAEPVSEHEDERADILAWKNDDYYLFEVKTRKDHPALMDRIDKKPDFEITEYSKEVRRSNTISSIIEKAASQLSKTPKPNNDFSCVWFRAVDHLIPDEMEIIQTSLYGIRHLLVWDSDKKSNYAECYYFDYSDFFNFKEINAVVIDNGVAIHICINNYSSRIREFRESELYRYFNGLKALIDPDKFEKDSSTLVADIDCPRNQVDRIKEYIHQKYGLQVGNIFEIKSLAGVIMTPKE